MHVKKLYHKNLLFRVRWAAPLVDCDILCPHFPQMQYEMNKGIIVGRIRKWVCSIKIRFQQDILPLEILWHIHSNDNQLARWT